MIYKIVVDKQPYNNPSADKRTYQVDIEELRALGDVYDSLVITSTEDYVMRRLSLSQYGVLSVLQNPVKEPIPNIDIELFEGDNYVYLMDMTGNKFFAKYIIKNDFTDTYVTINQMNSSITQTADQIQLSVSQTYETKSDANTNYSTLTQRADSIETTVSHKVGDDEIISKVNQSAEAVTINANKISLAGKVIDMTSDNIIINSDNFKVDKNGNMICSSATLGLAGGNGQTGGSNIFKIDSGRYVNLKEYYNRIIMKHTNSNLAIDMQMGDAASGISASMGVNSNNGYCTISSDDDSVPNMSCGNNSGYVSTISPNRIKSGDYMEATAYNYTSDARLKKEIKEYDTNALKLINKGKIYKYKFKSNEREEFGLVIGEGYNTPNELIENHNGVYSINAYRMSAIMWKAIQEQQEEIETLKNKIKELEDKLNE